MRCSYCGVLFSDVSRAEYDRGQHNVWHEVELADDTVAFYGAAREHAHRDFLGRYGPRGTSRLLDVGCGLGFFVSAALKEGWDAVGCDPSPAWVARARDRVGADRIVLGGVEGVTRQAPFDMITAWDVFEHIFDPLPFLARIARLLAPEGLLFIRTPNEAWVYPTYAVRRWVLGEGVELGPLNHVVYYRSATIRMALRACGLTVLAWPGLAPPQVSYGNRRPTEAGRRTLITAAKNAHARGTGSLAGATRGAIVLGADLDVVAAAGG